MHHGLLFLKNTSFYYIFSLLGKNKDQSPRYNYSKFVTKYLKSEYLHHVPIIQTNVNSCISPLIKPNARLEDIYINKKDIYILQKSLNGKNKFVRDQRSFFLT